MPLASEGSKIMAAILDWWYTPEKWTAATSKQTSPNWKKEKTIHLGKYHPIGENHHKSPNWKISSSIHLLFFRVPWIPHRQCHRLPCHLWCWHGANLTWKTAAGQRDISKFRPWKWEYSTYVSPLIVAIFHKNDKMWVKYLTSIIIHWWFPPIRKGCGNFQTKKLWAKNHQTHCCRNSKDEHFPGEEILLMDQIQRNSWYGYRFYMIFTHKNMDLPI